MTKKVSSELIWTLVGISVVTTIAAIALILYLNSSGNIEMSGHGWGAMLAGTILSMILGGGLTCALVWGRQNGYDERADITWDTGSDSDS